MLRRVCGFIAVAFVLAASGVRSPGTVVMARGLQGVQTAPGSQAAQSSQGVPTADEIIARNLKAKGGLEKWKSIESIKQTVHAVSQGAPADITMYGKRPNMQRQEVSVQGQLLVSAFDGQNAWMINPQMGPNPITLSGLQAQMTKQQSDFDGALVDYKTKGTVIELVGRETADGAQVYHLKVTPKSQSAPGTPPPVEHMFLDATTFLETKILSETNMGGMAMRTETDFADYRAVDGITMPFSIKTRSNGVLAVDMTVIAIQFNVKLDDTFFRMPVK